MNWWQATMRRHVRPQEGEIVSGKQRCGCVCVRRKGKSLAVSNDAAVCASAGSCGGVKKGSAVALRETDNEAWQEYFVLEKAVWK